MTLPVKAFVMNASEEHWLFKVADNAFSAWVSESSIAGDCTS